MSADLGAQSRPCRPPPPSRTPSPAPPRQARTARGTRTRHPARHPRGAQPLPVPAPFVPGPPARQAFLGDGCARCRWPPAVAEKGVEGASAVARTLPRPACQTGPWEAGARPGPDRRVTGGSWRGHGASARPSPRPQSPARPHAQGRARSQARGPGPCPVGRLCRARPLGAHSAGAADPHGSHVARSRPDAHTLAHAGTPARSSSSRRAGFWKGRAGRSAVLAGAPGEQPRRRRGLSLSGGRRPPDEPRCLPWPSGRRRAETPRRPDPSRGREPTVRARLRP